MAWNVSRRGEKAHKIRTPYVDWFVEVEEMIRPTGTTGFRQLEGLSLLPDAAARRLFGSGLEDLAKELLAEGYDSGREVPIPDHAIGSHIAPPAKSDWLPEAKDLEIFIDDLPDKDPVIVGIIDEGIALGHSRFRKADGKTTRFLHNWQQGGVWREPPDAHALPYGRDMFQVEINSKLAENSGPGGLDEEAFNRAIGITDYVHPRASRSVDRRASHGTHILDLAAGMDGDDADADRLRILSVTLPARPTVGLAGTFLAYFAIQGMLRLVDLADHISWAKHQERGKIPIVVNMSYGQQAGPKDGRGLFESIIRALNEFRAKQGYLPVRLIMPAGNDNLQRCRARWNAGKKPIELPWQILPEDQSSNFVEVWTDPVDRKSKKGEMPAAKSPVRFDLTLPNGEVLELAPGAPNQFDEITDDAGNIHGRVYTRIVPFHRKKVVEYRYNHVICIAPTLLHDANGWVAAPAGRWLLKIFNMEEGDLNSYVHVQVDQAARPDEDTSGRSYFDHPNYVTHDENGRVRDTYRYPLTGNAKEDQLEPANRFGPVQRKGTHNSIATYSEILVIGGYRESDGRPAPYSSSTQGSRRVPPGRELLTCAMPSETAPHHWGQLGAGTRSGSTVALSGTSFATAHMTRRIVAELLAGGDPAIIGSNSWAEGEAQKADSDAKALALKVGSGRLPRLERPLKRLETAYRR